MPVRGELPDTTPPPPRSRIVVIAAVLALIAAGIGAGWLLWGRDPQTPTAQPSPTATPSSSPSAAQPVTLLPRSTLTPGEGGRESLFGIPIRYPHTPEAGIQAAINYGLGTATTVMLSEASRPALVDYLFTDESRQELGATKEQSDEFRKEYGLNEFGQVLSADGTVDVERRLYGACFLQYGAYRVIESSQNSVTVETWAPCVGGVGTPTDGANLTVNYSAAVRTVQWVDGDWRMTSSERPEAPKPKDRGAFMISFAERASMLPVSEGWQLTADATEGPDGIPSGWPLS